jgi:hypothetical protein
MQKKPPSKISCLGTFKASTFVSVNFRKDESVNCCERLLFEKLRALSIKSRVAEPENLKTVPAPVPVPTFYLNTIPVPAPATVPVPVPAPVPGHIHTYTFTNTYVYIYVYKFANVYALTY